MIDEDDIQGTLAEPSVATYTWDKESPGEIIMKIRDALRELRSFDPVVCIYVRSLDEWNGVVSEFQETEEWAKGLVFFDVREHRAIPGGQAWVEFKSGAIQRFSLEKEAGDETV